MDQRQRSAGGEPVVVLFGLALALLSVGSTAARAAEEAVFKMRKVSVFDDAQRDPSLQQQLLQGQYAFCTTTPNELVKAYPKLKSKQPLYGTVRFGQSFIDPTFWVDFHFALDESTAESPSLLKRLVGALWGDTAEPRAGASYDRLYFDANRDLDLTNDPVLALMKVPPASAFVRGEDKKDVRIFDYLTVQFDCGPELGMRPSRMLPRLWVYAPGHAQMVFVPMVAREGKIRIGNQEYTAILAQSGTVTGRFDGPLTRLFLTPTGSSGQRSSSWGPEALCTMREVDGQLYRISATASGDQLTVRPYRGEFGLLEVAAGQRQIEKLGAAGMLMSDDQALMILGKMPNPSMERWEKWRQNRLPVGDYWPIHLAVDFGRVAVTLSQNSYSGGEVDDRQPKPPVYRIKIRKDTPFVLDFSGEPTVVFTGPGKGQTFKPGDTVKIEAVLTDAVLGMKINGLKDATRKMGDMKLTDHDGKEVTIPRYASLDPTVVITDSSRADVTSGKMPFG